MANSNKGSNSNTSGFVRPDKPLPVVSVADIENFVHRNDPVNAAIISAPVQPSSTAKKSEKQEEDPVAKSDKEEQSGVTHGRDKDENVRLKRLTIDIPFDLHKRVKAGAVSRETSIAVIIRDILERKFPPSKDK